MPRSRRLFAAAAVIVCACRPHALESGPPPTAPASTNAPSTSAAVVRTPPTLAQLEVASDVDLRPPADLTTAQVEEDVAWLLHALRYAWGGQTFVDADLISAVEARLTALSQDEPPGTPRQLCRALAELLGALPDAHFAATLEGSPDCMAAARRKPAVGRNVASGDARPWSFSVRRVGDRPVGVLGVSQFAPHDDSRWDGMVEAIDAAEVSAVVVDLRGNGGGDDTAAYWIAQALSGHFVRREGVRIVRSQQPVALTLVMNLMAFRMRPTVRAGEAPPAHLRRTREELAALRDAVADGREDVVLSFSPGPDRPLPRDLTPPPGPALVLADAGCGSSCENAVHLLRQMPKRVIVVGENTMGAIHSGQAGRLVLPNSRIVVQIATQWVRYPNDVTYEKVGFAPDVPVAAGDDALEIALAWLSSS